MAKHGARHIAKPRPYTPLPLPDDGDPRRPDKVKKYPGDIYQMGFLYDDLLPEFMSVLAVIFVFSGIMTWTRVFVWTAVYCSVRCYCTCREVDGKLKLATILVSGGGMGVFYTIDITPMLIAELKRNVSGIFKTIVLN